MSEVELKPCPFCGGEAEAVYAPNDINRWGVQCKSCGCTVEVEERLPIPHNEVWVTVKRNGKLFVSTDIVMGNGFWNYDTKNVLAWKEKDLIPDPYRPERSEGE